MKISSHIDYEALKKGLEVNKKQPVLVTFVNPFSYYLIQDLELSSEFDYIFSDGFFLCSLKNIFNKTNISRLSFDYSSIAFDFFNFCMLNSFKVALIGGTQDEIKESVKRINEKLVGGSIEFYRSGYFISEEEKRTLYSTINDRQLEVVVIGQGAPLQEMTAIEIRNNCPSVKICITCGGFLSQSVNGEYYPAYINKFNLRWLYRIFKHKHVRKKFFGSYPSFLLRFFKEEILW